MMHLIDYVPGTTFVHRLNPVTKLICAFALVLATIFSQTYGMLIGLLVISLLISVCSGTIKRAMKLIATLLPLACILMVLQCVVTQDGAHLFWFVTKTGIVMGSKAALRLVGVACPLALMMIVTKPIDLANACVEVLHLPYRYAYTFSTALRFVPLFSQEMAAIMDAQAVRGVRFDAAGPLKRLQLMLPLCIPLLVQSVRKADACALAAEQRGFYLRGPHSCYQRYPLHKADLFVLISALCLIVFSIIF